MEGFPEMILRHAKAALKHLGGPRVEHGSPLDATLLVVHVPLGSRDQAAVWLDGDGAYASRSTEGRLVAGLVSFPDGAPLYPIYRIEAERAQQWQATRPTRRVEMYDYGAISEDIQRHTIESPIAGNSMPYWNWNYWPLKYRTRVLAAFSDGITSFRGPGGEPIDPALVIQHLMTFKTTAGEFVKRRMRGFARECAALGWVHTDDLAMAAVHFDDLPIDRSPT